MKKIFSILFLICLGLLSLSFLQTNQKTVFAETTNQVVVIFNSSTIFKEASSSSEVVDEVLFGTNLVLEDENLFYDGTVSFYKVNNNGKIGYIVSNAVIKETEFLEKKLDPNAKIIKKNVNIYVDKNDSEESKLKIDGKEVVLKQYQEVKIIDGYDKNKEYNKIMFELDGKILTGYVKSENLIVEGFNGTIILVIFIFLLVVSIIVSIILTTRKKRKKSKKLKA